MPRDDRSRRTGAGDGGAAGRTASPLDRTCDGRTVWFAMCFSRGDGLYCCVCGRVRVSERPHASADTGPLVEWQFELCQCVGGGDCDGDPDHLEQRHRDCDRQQHRLAKRRILRELDKRANRRRANTIRPDHLRADCGGYFSGALSVNSDQTAGSSVLGISGTATLPITIYDAGSNGVSIPTLVREVKPSYTADAIANRIQGTVLLAAVVLPNGTVGEVTVLRSLDTRFGLDAQAVLAAKQWLFNPGMKDGLPVAVRVTIEMSFTLR